MLIVSTPRKSATCFKENPQKEILIENEHIFVPFMGLSNDAIILNIIQDSVACSRVNFIPLQNE